MRPRPLDVPELLDLCIGYLEYSPSDLLACALVARAWVHPAQSRLFRVAHVTNPSFPSNGDAISRFYRALSTSPHLLPLVKQLELDFEFRRRPHDNSIKRISALVFPRLQMLKVTLPLNPFWFDEAKHVKLLAGLANLHRLCLVFNSSLVHCADFLTDLPPVQHLELTFHRLTYDIEPDTLPATSVVVGFGLRLPDHHLAIPPGHTVQVVSLKSLRLFVSDFDESVMHPGAPLDLTLGSLNLSRMAAFSVDAGVSTPWNIIHKEFIQILDMDTIDSSTVIKLSEFPNLEFLRLIMYLPDDHLPYMILPTLRSSAQCKRLHTIVMSVPDSFHLPEAESSELDLVLSTKSSPAVSAVELEQRTDPDPNENAQFDEDMRNMFPLLAAKSVLRTTSRSYVSMGRRWTDLVDAL
ncbi:hypothetical protein R3P38DRAFT_3348638 [Favolaschia claudopus]|uniref:F-box domain-containing protein n=1 Tax=Favolaschia claudopus TaxID=2862362 RepID=A0AAW0CUF4_9AGAR